MGLCDLQVIAFSFYVDIELLILNSNLFGSRVE